MKQILALAALCALAVALSVPAGAQSAPVVVVYPLTVAGTADPQAGGKVSVIYANRLAALGGLSVKPPAPGTERKHYLDAALEAGADYYVTGYVSPLGDAVTLINQVVSTHSGIQVWSDTVQVNSYNEASAQADLIRTAILRHAGRYSASIDATPPPAPPATHPAAPHNEANLGPLFQRHATDQAAAPGQAGTPPPSTVTSLADVEIAVVHVGGPASDQAALARADSELAQQLTRRLKAPTPLDVVTTDFMIQGAQICKVTPLRPDARVFGGSISLTRIDPGFSPYAQAKFDLIVFDCDGNIVAKKHAEHRSIGRTADDLALDGAVDEALDAVLPKAPRGNR